MSLMTLLTKKRLKDKYRAAMDELSLSTKATAEKIVDEANCCFCQKHGIIPRA